MPSTYAPSLSLAFLPAYQFHDLLSGISLSLHPKSPGPESKNIFSSASHLRKNILGNLLQPSDSEGLNAFTERAQVQSMVKELRSCKLPRMAKK